MCVCASARCFHHTHTHTHTHVHSPRWLGSMGLCVLVYRLDSAFLPLSLSLSELSHGVLIGLEGGEGGGRVARPVTSSCQHTHTHTHAHLGGAQKPQAADPPTHGGRRGERERERERGGREGREGRRQCADALRACSPGHLPSETLHKTSPTQPLNALHAACLNVSASCHFNFHFLIEIFYWEQI